MHIVGSYLNAKPEIGSYKIYHDSFKAVVKSSIEVIATDMIWAEGPLWVDDASKSSPVQYLLYSDTVQNRVLRYDEGKGFFSVGKTVRIPLSGCKVNASECAQRYQVGSNGLARLYADPNAGADIVACQHGERAVTILYENGTRVFLATHYQGKRLNSPNDLAWSNQGHLYFTDPIYGLYDKNQESLVGQELAHSGVYMIHRDEIKKTLRTGQPTDNLQLLVDDLTLPNGITFSPGFVRVFISNSDPSDAIWRVYDVMDDGSFQNGRVFFNATHLLAKGHQGMPDGMKVDSTGRLYASGPGGVLVFSPEGNLIGRLVTEKVVSNVALAPNGMLYMTATDSILRVRLAAKPAKVVGALK